MESTGFVLHDHYGEGVKPISWQHGVMLQVEHDRNNPYDLRFVDHTLETTLLCHQYATRFPPAIQSHINSKET